jgi:16S rRNA processing protein RimM
MYEDAASTGPVIVGRVLAPRGPAGEVKVEVISDSPARFSKGSVLYLKGQTHRIQRSYRLPRGTMALKLEGINSRNEAEDLRDCFLTVSEDMTPPLPEGEYYHFQIIDMSVYTRKLEYLGQITQILPTGSNDVYVVSDEDEELLIPAVDEVIVEVDVAQGTMTVDLPDGLRPGH